MLEKYSKKLTKNLLIKVLQDIQTLFGYLPHAAIDIIANKLGLSISELQSVATFYNHFRFHPIGKHLVQVCHGTACHVAGAGVISDTISYELKLGNSDTTKDLKYTVKSIACLGCCSLAPCVMIDGKVYGRLSSGKIKKTINEIGK